MNKPLFIIEEYLSDLNLYGIKINHKNKGLIFSGMIFYKRKAEIAGTINGFIQAIRSGNFEVKYLKKSRKYMRKEWAGI